MTSPDTWNGTGNGATPARVQYRRAIEALRAGVPNRDAVRALGSLQPAIEKRFLSQLESAQTGLAAGKQAAGLIISGGFGSGKSHTLEYLQHLALEENFVCSRIVVSKETPLYDPAKLYRAAIQSAVVPNKTGSALHEIVRDLPSAAGYADFVQLVNDGSLNLNARFAATLFLLHQLDPEIRDRIVSFWSGDPLGVGELRRWLRAYGEAATYNLDHITTKDLFLQRFRFAPRLIVAAGYAGWLLLIDEVELIGRYTLRQRAHSYAELARWVGRPDGDSLPGLTAVLAITDDYATSVLEGKNDLEYIPGRLRAWDLSSAGDALVRQAEQGMRLIQHAARLQPASYDAIDEMREQVRWIYEHAYAWPAPLLPLERRERSTSMRQYVRRWITEWDLRRLEPGYAPDLIVGDVQTRYGEDRDLATPSDEEEGGETEAGGRA